MGENGKCTTATLKEKKKKILNKSKHELTR